MTVLDHKEYMREYLQRPVPKAKHLARVHRYMVRNKKFFRRVMRLMSCVDCGVNTRLEWDHIVPRCGDDRKLVSYLVSISSSIKRIKQEMRLCQVRCKPCHMKQPNHGRHVG